MLEASNLAQDLLEVQLARSVYDMPVGVLASIAGQLQDQTAYQADVESYSLVGAGPAYVGLTDQDIKRVRVSVRWRDLTGVRLTQAESVLARLAK
jgi:shikimate kinase